MKSADDLWRELCSNFAKVSPPVGANGGTEATTREPPKASLTGGLFAEELERLPLEPRQWIVKDMIPDEHVTGFYGDGGVGKDLVLMQLAAAMISNRRWLGFEVKQGPVLYCPVEDDMKELRRRQDAVGKSYGIRSFREFPRKWKLLPFAGSDAVLAVFDRQSGLVKPTPTFFALDQELKLLKPRLVIVGNRVNIFSVDQISDTQARQCVSFLYKLAIENKCAIIMPGHPSRAGKNDQSGQSGSVQWQNAVRSQLYLDRADETDRDARVLTVKKSNYAPDDTKISLRWSDGVFVRDGGAAPLPELSEEADQADGEFQRMLRIYTTEKRPPSAKPNAPNNAPKLFAEDRRCSLRGRTGKARLKDAMDRLFAAGKITSHEEGPPSRRRSWLVMVPSNSPSNCPSNYPSNSPSHSSSRPPTPLATHSPVPPSVRVPACESGQARTNGVGADEGEIVL